MADFNKKVNLKGSEDLSSMNILSSHPVFNDNDLIMEFLIRLPVKALFRSNCVCKGWRGLISNPDFVERFIERSESLPPILTGVFFGQNKWFHPMDAEVSFYDLVNDFDLNHSPIVDTTLSFLQRPVLVVAAASNNNGLLLCVEKPLMVRELGLGEAYRFQYILCNPLLKQWVDLPKSDLYHHIKGCHLFCYSKDESDGQLKFKVVVSLGCHQIDMFSSETGQWKQSGLPHDDSMTLIRPYLFDGFLYIWGSQQVFVYNVKDESFSKIPSPPRRPSWPGYTGRSGGSLCYAESSRSGYRVWVLVDGCRWSLRHHIDYIHLAKEVPELSGFAFHTFAFHPLHQKLVLVNLEREYDYYRTILYHTDTRRIQVIKDLSPHLRSVFAPVVPYTLPASLGFLRIL